MRANGSGVGFCCPRWTTSFRILLFSPQFLSLSPSRVSPLFGSLSKRRVACPVHLDRATTASASTSATSSSAGAPLPCSLLFNVLDAYWTHHSNKRIAVWCFSPFSPFPSFPLPPFWPSTSLILIIQFAISSHFFFISTFPFFLLTPATSSLLSLSPSLSTMFLFANWIQLSHCVFELSSLLLGIAERKGIFKSPVAGQLEKIFCFMLAFKLPVNEVCRKKASRMRIFLFYNKTSAQSAKI